MLLATTWKALSPSLMEKILPTPMMISVLEANKNCIEGNLSRVWNCILTAETNR